MSGLVVIGNPRRKRTRRKMTAKQRKYFAPKRRRSVKRNPVAATRRRRRTSYARPSTRRRKSRSRGVFAVVRRVRARSSGFMQNWGLDTILPSAIGAAGALGLDMAWGYLPLPSTLQTGPLAPVVRLAGAFGIGIAAGAIAGKKFGREVTAGATVVTLYDLFKGWIASNYPSAGLQGVGCGQRRFYNAGINIGRAKRLGYYLSEFTPDYVNEQNQDSDNFAPFYNAAPGDVGFGY